MSSRALIYGRFQPFHLGHLLLTRWTLERFEELVFLIGMASESYTFENPFTAGERIIMIRRALSEAGIDLSRIITATIPTLEVGIGNVSQVLSYVPAIDALVTRNFRIMRIFRDAGLKVIVPPAFDRARLKGEVIRRLMVEGDEDWKNRVPTEVYKYIEEIDGINRLKEIVRYE